MNRLKNINDSQHKKITEKLNPENDNNRLTESSGCQLKIIKTL